jgi:hypothetical protein
LQEVSVLKNSCPIGQKIKKRYQPTKVCNAFKLN